MVNIEYVRDSARGKVISVSVLSLLPEGAAGPLQALKLTSRADTDKKTENFFTKIPPTLIMFLDMPRFDINYSTMFLDEQRTIFINYILIIAPLEFIDMHGIMVYSEFIGR